VHGSGEFTSIGSLPLRTFEKKEVVNRLVESIHDLKLPQTPDLEI